MRAIYCCPYLIEALSITPIFFLQLNWPFFNVLHYMVDMIYKYIFDIILMSPIAIHCHYGITACRYIRLRPNIHTNHTYQYHHNHHICIAYSTFTSHISLTTQTQANQKQQNWNRSHGTSKVNNINIKPHLRSSSIRPQLRSRSIIIAPAQSP